MISDEKIDEIMDVLSTPDAYALFDKEKEVCKVFIKEYLDCNVEWLNQSLEKLGVKVKLECVHFINNRVSTCVMCYMFSCEEL